jgi:hypothetical protein
MAGPSAAGSPSRPTPVAQRDPPPPATKPAARPTPGSSENKTTPPPATREPQRATTKPDVVQLELHAEIAAKDYFGARADYQSTVREIEASNAAPKERHTRLENADRLINLSWTNAQRATAAYYDFVNSAGPSLQIAGGEAWKHSQEAEKLQDLAYAKLAQLKNQSKPTASPAAIEKAGGEYAMARTKSIEAGKVRLSTSDAIDFNSWRITRARDLRDFARSGPNDHTPFPKEQPYINKGI